MAAASLSLSTLYPIKSSSRHDVKSSRTSPDKQLKNFYPCLSSKKSQAHSNHGARRSQKFTISAVTEGSAKSSKSEETMPSWAKPGSKEPPPWASSEGKESSEQPFEVPFYVYLLASAITAIAAIGSMFEYANKNPVFGVLNPDSSFYAPVLGFFAFTGVPTSAYLWFKSVQTANKEAEEQDRRDGYR